ncbi:MAG: tetratricopeptide repeat protein [Emcibacter sp.]|nr:tetratricopeptide repeat protein [Emcibacter sp.]
MIQKFSKIIILLIGCGMLASCAGERRVDGEMAFDSGSLMNMAESFLKAGDYGNAMRLYQRAANENPKHIASRLGLAKTYQAIGASDAAINFYEQVLQLDPSNMDAQMGSGQMLITKNRPEEAIPYLTALSKQDPKNYRIFNMLGLAHDLKGEQEEAQMNYGRGLELAKNNISLLNNLALSFAFEEQYAPAIRLLSKAINLDYSVTKAQQNLVLVYVLSGEEAAGRKIGSSLMTEEEMNNNIRHYKWVKSLKASQRAQAIFLGIKNFPNEGSMGKIDRKPITAPIITKDPKKRQLMELLEQENSQNDRMPAHTQKPVDIAQAVKPEENYNSPKKIYRLQLASYPNLKIANRGWTKIQKRSKGILEAYEPLVKLVTLANGKTLFRLFVGGIEERAIAKSVCDNLRDKAIDCLVLKTNRD